MRIGLWGAAAALMLASWSVSAAGSASLPIETIKVETAHGARAFNVEIAADSASQERGLMYRDQMAPDHGMLFDFHQPETVAFWMKNTKLPLDMVFIRADGTKTTIYVKDVCTISVKAPATSVLKEGDDIFMATAKYGKGTYIYTGYAFFRQLPVGVPGAVRLFVNLLSAGHEPH